MKTWDVIIIGGGIIGLSVSIALRKRGASVLIVERGEPGREASHAAAGMLADFPLEMPPRSNPSPAPALACTRNLFMKYRTNPASMSICVIRAQFFSPRQKHLREHPSLLDDCPLPSPLTELEPALGPINLPGVYLKERSVDPRALTSAALKAARHREVDISSGTAITRITQTSGKVTGVATERSKLLSPRRSELCRSMVGSIATAFVPATPGKGTDAVSRRGIS